MTAYQQEVLQIIDKNVNDITQLIHVKINIWIYYELLTWRWWIGVGFTIVPWIVWYVFTKKNLRIDRYLSVGFLIIIIQCFLMYSATNMVFGITDST